jgi:hypothetical protein
LIFSFLSVSFQARAHGSNKFFLNPNTSLRIRLLWRGEGRVDRILSSFV